MGIAVKTPVADAAPRTFRTIRPGETIAVDARQETVSPEIAALQTLLRIERDARRAGSEDELLYLAANETRKLVQGRQFFMLTWDGAHPTIKTISSLTNVDREAPFVHWLEALVARKFGALPPRAVAFDSSRDIESDDRQANHYPFAHMLVLPMHSKAGHPLGALLAARETEWDAEALQVGERLAETYAHAWAAFRRGPRLAAKLARPTTIAVAASVVFAALCFVPTRLTALAGFEIVPDRPFVVAAPSDGVIEKVEVQPNSEVKPGDVLYRAVATTLRDNLLIAERAMAVAEAKWKQYLQGAFYDPQAKRELAAAQAEYDLKRAERDYARDLVAKTVARAPRAGIAIFNDANELSGRPVSTGQRIMEIADRAQVLVRINVPVEDSIVLSEGARVKVYLDSDPLHALEATITHADHGARLIEGNQFVYRADARLAADAAIPRLGVRGTAQIYGPSTSLMLYLFRRPLSYLRQHVGL